MPSRKLFENVCVEKLRSVVQPLMLSQTYLAVRLALFYDITQLMSITDVSGQPIHPILKVRDRYVVPKRLQGVTAIRYVISQKSVYLSYIAAEACNHAQNLPY
jgi:hypothetical protein